MADITTAKKIGYKQAFKAITIGLGIAYVIMAPHRTLTKRYFKMSILLKRITGAFLIYFSALAFFGLYHWIYNLKHLEGERFDAIFLFALLIISIFYALITLWTYLLYKSKSISKNGAIIHLAGIFLLGICSSIAVLLQVYAGTSSGIVIGRIFIWLGGILFLFGLAYLLFPLIKLLFIPNKK